MAIHAVLDVPLAKRTAPLKVKLKCWISDGKRGVEHCMASEIIIVVHHQNASRRSGNGRRSSQASRSGYELTETEGAAERTLFAVRTGVMVRTSLKSCRSQDECRHKSQTAKPRE